MNQATKARAPKKARKTASSRPKPHRPSEEDIRRRAYEKFLSRGGQHGHDLDDWLEAERELGA